MPATRDAGEGKKRRLAVLDLGSTSFHLLVADVYPDGKLVRVDREREMLRLGSVIALDGSIPKPVRKQVFETARDLRETAERLGAEEIFAVGTAALRDADNGDRVSAALASAIGEPVRILSGKEEARLIFRAFRQRLDLPKGVCVGIDLGGGSLEVAAGAGKRLQVEATLALGAARLHRQHVSSDPMRKREILKVCDVVRAALAPLVPRIAELSPGLVVATGGTARGVGRVSAGLRGKDETALNGRRLSVAKVREVTELLVHAPEAERLEIAGVRRRRVDLLPTGALILLTTLESLGLEKMTLCDWGLREGVLLEAVCG